MPPTNHITEHEPIPCLVCGRNLASAYSPGSREEPEAGNFSLCIHCGGVSIFELDEDGAYYLRPPTIFEAEVFNTRYRHLAAQAARQREQRNQDQPMQ